MTMTRMPSDVEDHRFAGWLLRFKEIIPTVGGLDGAIRPPLAVHHNFVGGDRIFELGRMGMYIDDLASSSLSDNENVFLVGSGCSQGTILQREHQFGM
jgi:hypothetical protein